MKNTWLRKTTAALIALSFMLAGPTASLAASEGESMDGRVSALEQELADLKKENKERKLKFKFYGDFETEYNYLKAKFPEQYSMWKLMSNFDTVLNDMNDGLFEAAVGSLSAKGEDLNVVNIQNEANAIFGAMPPEMIQGMLMEYAKIDQQTTKNENIITNRLRLNLEAKASKSVTFKGRLSMYKIWGMQDSYPLTGGGNLFPLVGEDLLFDAGPTHTPTDNAVRVDRAYMNWVRPWDSPTWFSIGRRPTTNGPPTQLRQGLDFEDRQATPAGLGIDYAFDGLAIGWYMDDQDWYNLEGGKLRFCYGKGFEAGFDTPETTANLKDALFYGLSWDIINDKKDKNMFATLQVFRADSLPDSLSLQDATANLGGIWSSAFTFMKKHERVEWFLSGGWTLTQPTGYTNAMEGMLSPDMYQAFVAKGINMEPGILTNPGEELKDKNGYALYLGVRGDATDWLQLGAEYNWGSENWVGFHPSHDEDLLQHKLATRGHVFELYSIWHLPVTFLDENSRAFLRAGYQYYDYEYTGSGSYLGKPVKISNLDQEMTVLPSPDTMHVGYISFNIYF